MPTNPYLSLDLAGLAHECGRLAIDITTQRARTSDERQILAGDVAQLLVAVNGHLTQLTSPYQPQSPAREHEAGASLIDAYADFATTRERQARHVALHLASERHFGPQVRPWYLDTRIEGRPAIDVATESPTGLRRALELLQALPRNRR